MAHAIAQSEWEDIVGKVLDTSTAHLRSIGRANFHMQNNERFYHHQFSCFLARHLASQSIDIWTEQLLWPEAKTIASFCWKALHTEDPEESRDALSGQKANYDFVIQTTPTIRVEWKGPWMYSVQDMAEVGLKLIHQVPDEDNKIICAILASSRTGNRRHCAAIEEHFKTGLQFACDLLGVDCIESKNLFAYIATITDTRVLKCHWGRVTSLNNEWEISDAEQSTERDQ